MDGRSNDLKEQRRAQNHAYYEANKDVLLKRSKEWRKKMSGEEQKAYRHETYLKARAKGYDGNKSYNEMTDDEKKTYNRERYQRISEASKLRQREKYNAMTPEQHAEYNARKKEEHRKYRERLRYKKAVLKELEAMLENGKPVYSAAELEVTMNTLGKRNLEFAMSSSMTPSEYAQFLSM